MKKAFSTAIIATLIIASSAWADDANTTVEVTSTNTEMTTSHHGPKTRKELREERLEMRKEMQGEIKDYRKEHRADMKEAKGECRTRLEAATTDAEKESIKEECKAEAKAQREALRENIKEVRAETYSKILASIKTKIEAKWDKIKELPEDKKDAWKEKMNTALDNLEDKANEKGKDADILTIAAIRELVDSL